MMLMFVCVTPEKTIDEIEGYREIIKENIEYDSLLLAHPYDQEMVEGTFDLILETVLSKNGEITIAGNVYPKNLVKSKFLKFNYSHVEYVIASLGKNTTKVRNIKSYLLASLFNAGSTISSYYKAEVNHDMPQFAGNRATRIPCVVGANSASTTEKSLEMRQINNHINHFEMKLNLTLLETGIILGL